MQYYYANNAISRQTFLMNRISLTGETRRGITHDHLSCELFEPPAVVLQHLREVGEGLPTGRPKPLGWGWGHVRVGRCCLRLGRHCCRRSSRQFCLHRQERLNRCSRGCGLLICTWRLWSQHLLLLLLLLLHEGLHLVLLLRRCRNRHSGRRRRCEIMRQDVLLVRDLLLLLLLLLQALDEALEVIQGGWLSRGPEAWASIVTGGCSRRGRC